MPEVVLIARQKMSSAPVNCGGQNRTIARIETNRFRQHDTVRSYDDFQRDGQIGEGPEPLSVLHREISTRLAHRVIGTEQTAIGKPPQSREPRLDR